MRKAATVKKKLRRTGRATRIAQVAELWKLAVVSLPQKNMSEKESIVGRMMLNTTSWRSVNRFSILAWASQISLKPQLLLNSCETSS